jgi:uncharacterized protein YwbE
MVSIQRRLRTIDNAAVEALDVATRLEARAKAGSQREGYERSLREIERVAGKQAAGELTEWIVEQIHTNEKFPHSKKVRNHGAKICRSQGFSMSDNDWLGA